MTKTLERRNIVTIYVRNQYIPVWEEFRKLVVSDPDFKAKRYKQSDSLMSIGIMTLMARYIKDRHSKKLQGEVVEEQ